ncbi:hypothetical protein HXZ94_06715 [Empedobacter falsenii]|uniref:hypothetical protein n=1 Tax=Empedobacter TaxID=59734 RepID=UPI0013204595|nr:MULTISPECIES: hypothetical protein [Empedobacter]MDM1298190.1 hypothetical protein [Empedobacter falsenii]MDM1317735.1 hypothetical protein [Empedobacter falsenii]QHC84922.1 hypothetical protein AS589_09150 [Empedobacter brevis]
MQGLDYNSIKRKIESETCPHCNKKPKFKQTSKGFQIDTCCEVFDKIIKKKSEKIVEEESKKAIEKMFKNGFK